MSATTTGEGTTTVPSPRGQLGDCAHGLRMSMTCPLCTRQDEADTVALAADIARRRGSDHIERADLSAAERQTDVNVKVER